jgi:hypothetical protein
MISLRWPTPPELCISSLDSIRIYWDWNVRIRDFEQSLSPDQPEPPHWNIDPQCLAREGHDDVTEQENDIFALELILANLWSNFRYSGKTWVIITLHMRLPFSDLSGRSSTDNATTVYFNDHPLLINRSMIRDFENHELE